MSKFSRVRFRLKCLYSCFSSHFCFIVIFILLMFVLSWLFLFTVNSLPLSFFIYSSNHCFDASLLSSMLVSPLLPSFLDTYNLSSSSLECKTLCMVISFLVLWSICLCFSHVHIKNGPDYLPRGTAQAFISLRRFLQHSLVSCSFYVLLIYSFFFLILSFISTSFGVSVSTIPKYL